MITKTKINCTLHMLFFPCYEYLKLLLIAWNSDWFMLLLAPVVIGWSNKLVLVFGQYSFENFESHLKDNNNG